MGNQPMITYTYSTVILLTEDHFLVKLF